MVELPIDRMITNQRFELTRSDSFHDSYRILSHIEKKIAFMNYQNLSWIDARKNCLISLLIQQAGFQLDSYTFIHHLFDQF